MEKNNIFQTLIFAVVITVIIGLAGSAYALNVPGLPDMFEVGGYIQNETSIRTSEPSEILWSENRFQLDVLTKIKPEKCYLYFSGLFYYDAVYDMQQGYGYLSHDKQRRELRQLLSHNRADTLADPIREAYLDLTVGKFDMRLGKQQIVWGETDAFKMLDIINPTDIRHFNQDVWENSRITLWSAKFDYNVTENSQLEYVLIPDVEPMPSAFLMGLGHPFTPLAFRTLPPFPMNTHDVKKTIGNTEWGFRWYQNFGNFNYTLNYFQHWTDSPGAYLDLKKFKIDLKYKKMHSIGGSWSWNFSNFLGLKHVVWRFESVLNLKDLQSAINYAKGGLPETVRSDNFNYALVMDKTFYRPYSLWPSGLSFTFELFQTYILDYEDNKHKRYYTVGQTGKHADEVETILAAIFTSSYLPGEYLTPTLLVAYKDDGDWWISPSLAYAVTEKITATVGLNYYTGPFSGLIGEFHKASNVLFRIKYGF